MNTTFEKLKSARTFLKLDFTFLQNRITNFDDNMSFSEAVKALRNLDKDEITDDEIYQLIEDVEDFIFTFNTVWTYYFRVPIEYNDCPTITVSGEKHKVKIIEYDKIQTCDGKTFNITALECVEDLLEILIS